MPARTETLLTIALKLLGNQQVSRAEFSEATRELWSVLPSNGRFPAFRAALAGIRQPELVVALPIILTLLTQRISSELLCSLYDSLREHSLFREDEAPGSIPELLSSVGTGGKQIHTLNVSTASAIIAASCGARIVRSGTRRYFSRSGANDFLRSRGVSPLRTGDNVCRLIRTTGLAFLDGDEFSRSAQPLLRVIPRLPATLKPWLGALSHPIRQAVTLIRPHSSEYAHRGISLPATHVVAEALQSHRGYRRGLVVHSRDRSGRVFDELSNFGPTQITEFDESGTRTYIFHPEDVGLRLRMVEEIEIRNSESGYRIVDEIFRGLRRTADPYCELLALNAGSMLYAGSLVATMKEGVEKALTALSDGSPHRWLEQYRECVASSTAPVMS